jgi:hypothetical protein
VQHEPRVREAHRVCHLQEQAQPLGEGRPPGAAIGIDRNAIDRLHRKVRPARLGDAGVVEARDVRVLQRGRDVALAGHALGQTEAPAGTRQLQRHLTLHASVDLLGEPDQRHAAGADLADRVVRTEAVAGAVGRGVGGFCLSLRDGGDGNLQWAAQEIVGLDPGTAMHAPQHGHERTIAGRQGRQPSLAFVRAQLEQLLQQRVDACEPRGVVDVHAAQRPSISASSSRARSQSRRTVRSVTPRAAPISTSLSPAK